ncbi:hypothetical protein B0H16DRAFT_1480421 [Mycena metata]|uniref:Uncharacterized protein n=1 Tax=Mycena metata TaxID=1033252 RepID=A0AAD7MCV0_9AGAR|nr:hypothetical protein B0H16DRAFT_1480421 [Mycena metata]
MSDHPIAPGDELISFATAALRGAEADARDSPDRGMIFRPEWRPTPRSRSSEDQPLGTRPGAHKISSWASVVNELSRLQQTQPSHSATDSLTKPTSLFASTSIPLSSAGSGLTLGLPPKHTLPPQVQEDPVAELLRTNQDVLNAAIPRQDVLQTCARLKMKAVSEGSDNDVEAFGVRHKASLEQIKRLKEICVTMLGIPESIMEATPRSVALDTTEHFFKTVLQGEDALLAYYVVLLPCVLIYWTIAQRLMENPSTVRNTVYHRAWTVENYDPSSVEKYKTRGGVKRWNWMFNIACRQESEIFSTGLQVPVPFHIIPDATYSIHIFSVKNFVLTVQNVTNPLQPPVNKYFPSAAGSFIVGKERTGGDNERVFATSAGYTFKNVGTDLYLGTSPLPDHEEYRVLQAVLNPYFWWVNPNAGQSNQYQYANNLSEPMSEI